MNLTAKISMTLAGLALASQALADPCPVGGPPTNCAPPTGAILDLAGTPVPHTYTQYSVNFEATQASTNLSFAFREDPAYLFLDDVSVTLAGGGSNLVTNGGFEAGVVGASAPVGWTYLNQFGAAAGGQVTTSTPHSGSNAYADGAVQAYDGITQAIATTVGQIYTISFWLTDNGGLTTFSDLSTNGNTTGTGGNGIDLLVYAGAVPTTTPPVPEPQTYALMLAGLGLLGLVARRSKR